MKHLIHCSGRGSVSKLRLGIGPRLGLLFLGAGGLAAAAFFPAQTGPYSLILGGDTDGYLSPCGCTFPMTGGIRRRASAIRALGNKGRTIVLENGGLIAGNGDQDQMKALAMAEFLGSVGVSAVNVGPAEAKLGQGFAISLGNVTQGKAVSTSVAPSQSSLVKPFIAAGPFLIGGISTQAELVALPLMEKPLPSEAAVSKLIEEAGQGQLTPILMLQGTHADAVALAKRFPALGLIQYRGSGDPPRQVEKVGNTILATPGEHGKYLLRLTFEGGRFTGYSPVRLSPDVKDDKAVSAIYRAYEDRVAKGGLLEQLPRRTTGSYAGSWSCITCHQDAGKVWKKSGHAHALATLEKEHHDRDPDCVSCHVVGLESTKGFLSRKLTPALADVGCESCHGPGAAHARAPKLNPLPKVGEKSCLPCHTPMNSPNFDFKAYWKKIQHR